MSDDNNKGERGHDLDTLENEKPQTSAGVANRSAIGGGSDSDASPGGLRNTGAAGDDLPQNDLRSTAPGPDGRPSGPADEGSYAAGTYNERGVSVGPDSPAGYEVDLQPQAEDAQGDALADKLGGGEGRGTGMSGAGAATGDMRAESSDEDSDDLPGATDSGGPDAGSPGGMGGVHGHTGTRGRPPGGSSPLQYDPHKDDES